MEVLQLWSIWRKLNIHTPNNFEVVWGLLKPKNTSAKFKKIIVCSFYSPPNKKKNSKMADYLVSTLQMLCTKYPECGLILGADKNGMNITPILNCGLRLRQVVDKCKRNWKILDILIMNLSCHYKSAIIAPPIQPDNPNKEKPSDHSATHFAEISQEFPPLDVTTLPLRVQNKLNCKEGAPVVTEFEAYCKIRAAKKPRSGVPNDLPKVITQEFAPELAYPISMIVNRKQKRVSGQHNGN